MRAAIKIMRKNHGINYIKRVNYYLKCASYTFPDFVNRLNHVICQILQHENYKNYKNYKNSEEK